MASWQTPNDESPVYPSTPADNPYLAQYPSTPADNPYLAQYPGAYGYPYPPPGYGYPYPPPPGERRPGTLTAAAVLGYVTAGLLILAAIVLFDGASIVNDIDDAVGTSHSAVTAELVIDGLFNLAAAGLLIAGSVMMTERRAAGRGLYSGGAAIVVVAAIYWLARWSGPVGDAAGIIVYALLFGALTVVGLSLAWTRLGTQWLRRTG